MLVVPLPTWRSNYVTARFGSKASHLTAQEVAELRKQASQ